MQMMVQVRAKMSVYCADVLFIDSCSDSKNFHAASSIFTHGSNNEVLQQLSYGGACAAPDPRSFSVASGRRKIFTRDQIMSLFI